MEMFDCEPASFDMLYNPNHTFVHSPCRNEMTGKFGVTVRNLINTLLLSLCSLASPFMYPYEFNERIDDCPVEFDFIIVGAGTAGSIVANRLTEINSWKVLSIEAGGDPPMSTEVPSSHYSARKTPADWNFHTEPSFLYQGLKDSVDRWAAGKVLGGSSAIGRMMYHRGHPWGYQRWAYSGLKKWTWDDILPYFEKTEEVYEAKDFASACDIKTAFTTRGNKGFQKLRKWRPYDGLPELFLKAAKELGYRGNDEPKMEHSSGFFYSLGTLKDGERVSTARAYLIPMKKRTNFYILKHAQATKIVTSPGKHRAVGVQFTLPDGLTRTVYAKKEVIVSAGTINTPKLLMLSGIGRESHLSYLGIPVVQDSQVGDNLQDHSVFTGLVYSVNISAYRPVAHHRRRLDSAYEYLTRRTGEMATIFGSIITGFISFFEDSEAPNVMYRFEVFEHRDFDTLHDFEKSHNLNLEITKLLEEALDEHDILFIMPVLLSPKSNGTIRLRSCNPSDPPLIHSGYYMNDDDINIMLMAIRFAQNFLNSHNMMVLDPEQLRLKPSGCFDETWDSELYWKCMMFEVTSTFNDYVGTAKMGPSTDPSAVVNDRLQVYGVGHLRVIDASVMPFIPTAPTLAATAMIAERGAEFIKHEWITEKKSNSSIECHCEQARQIPSNDQSSTATASNEIISISVSTESETTTDEFNDEFLSILKLMGSRP